MANFPGFLRLSLMTYSTAYLLSYSAHSATLEAISTEPSAPGAAIASDQPGINSQDATSVALEILRLQQELGGSIVTDSDSPIHYHYNKTPTPPARPLQASHPYQPGVPQQPTPVEALRQTSWQLEQSAHLLESLDLYDQADAVRATASQLRQDARKLKTQIKPNE